MLEWILYFIAYFFAGLFLKVGDDILDESDTPSLAWYPLGVSGILFGLLMTFSEWDLVLLGSIVIGVLLSGKVNRKEFLVGFVAIAIILLVLGIPPITNYLDWLTILFILFMSSVLDEKGTDWTDKNRNPLITSFFEYRFTLKIVGLLLVIPWFGFLAAALGLWMFDIGYELAGYIRRRKSQQGQ